MMDAMQANMRGIDDGYHGKMLNRGPCTDAGFEEQYRKGYRSGWDERVRVSLREQFDAVAEKSDNPALEDQMEMRLQIMVEQMRRWRTNHPDGAIEDCLAWLGGLHPRILDTPNGPIMRNCFERAGA